MKTRLTLVITAVLLLTLALLPLYARWLEEPFLLTFSTRALVLALAVVALLPLATALMLALVGSAFALTACGGAGSSGTSAPPTQGASAGPGCA